MGQVGIHKTKINSICLISNLYLITWHIYDRVAPTICTIQLCKTSLTLVINGNLLRNASPKPCSTTQEIETWHEKQSNHEENHEVP
jgi:hypothetical protein